MADCFEEYIDRWIFIAEKRKRYCVDCNRRKGMKNGKLRFCYDIGEAPCRACETNDMLNDVEDFPSADVQPVRHGRWVDTEPNKRDWDYRKNGMAYYCSCCLHRAGKEKHKTYKYCPWCGAKMDKEKE